MRAKYAQNTYNIVMYKNISTKCRQIMLTICMKMFHPKCRQNYEKVKNCQKIAKIFITMNFKMSMAIFSYFVILSAFCVKNLHTNY